MNDMVQKGGMVFGKINLGPKNFEFKIIFKKDFVSKKILALKKLLV